MVLVGSKCGVWINLHQGSATGDALDDLDACKHRSRSAIPFRQYQYVASAELQPAHRATTGRLLLEDFRAALGNQRSELPIQVLMLHADARPR